MTSQVYYRKWRPSSFAELVGQEHVATTLRHAVTQQRLSHAYLFCGPRGSGKTTTARLIAKAANCLEPEDGDPCNACNICLAANDGRFLDIIELDAASNRGIDEIRDIREKVNLSPAQGRRKAYIIDEAHMLTDAASNAFLKTLEEPPAHVIFILCTTEVHKIPPTIISRCQRFDFRRIPSGLIYNRLKEIVDTEGVAAEPEALRLVSRQAAGSLRDAQNLLEQLVVSQSEGVGLRHVEDLLGLGHSENWLELVTHLLMGNTSSSLGLVNQAAWDGTDLRHLHQQTLELLRAALLLRWDSAESLDLPDHVTSQLQQLVDHVPPWRIGRAVKTWGEVNMRYDAPSTLPLELAVVEICGDQAPTQPVEVEHAAPAPAKVNSAPKPRPAAPARSAPAAAEAAQPQPSAPNTGTPVNPGAPPGGAPSEANDATAQAWAATVKLLTRHKGKKYNLGALLRDCRADAISLEEQTLVLAFTHRAHMERMQEEMDDPKARDVVTEIIGQHFSGAQGFRLTLIESNGVGSASLRSAQNSPLVRAAMGMGAVILEEVPE